MAKPSKSESMVGCTMHTWSTSRAPVRLRPTRLGILAVMSLVLSGCPQHQEDELSRAMKACAMGWKEEASFAMVAQYDASRKLGMVQWKAALESTNVLLEEFDDDEVKIKVYKAYLTCMKPSLDKFVSEDQRPAVIVVGSNEDYGEYKLGSLEATSAMLLHEQLGMTFKVTELTVNYEWDNKDWIRDAKPVPAVVVMHASAFHHDQYKDEAVEKFQALVSYLYYGMPNTTFVIFSRLPPENPASDLCQRWDRQVNFLRAAKFQERLVFYPLRREDSNFTGKAGIEISGIIRCLSGLDATGYSSIYLRQIKDEAQQRIATSSCNATTQ